MSSAPTRPREDPLLWSVSGLPFLLLLGFYAFVFRAWMSLGELPDWRSPGPDSLGFDLHQIALIGAFRYGPWLLLGLAALALVLAATAAGRRSIGKPLTLLISGSLLTVFVLRVDPGGFVHWFLA